MKNDAIYDAEEKAWLWKLSIKRAIHTLASSIRPIVKRIIQPIAPLYFQPAQMTVASSYGIDPTKVSQPIGAPSYTEVKWDFEGVIFILLDSALKVTSEEYLQAKEEIIAACSVRNLLILNLYSLHNSDEIAAMAVSPKDKEQAADFINSDRRWREGNFHKFVYDLDEILSNDNRIVKAISEAFKKAAIENSNKRKIMTCDDLLEAYYMHKIIALVLTNGIFKPVQINTEKYLDYASYFRDPPMRYITNEAMENPFNVTREVRMQLMIWQKV